jgi:hypothetical protein
MVSSIWPQPVSLRVRIICPFEFSLNKYNPVRVVEMSSLYNFCMTLLCLSACATSVLASPQIPAAPGLTYLYSLNCTLGPSIQVGGGPHGTRVVIPIIGGTFSGPQLSGTNYGLPTLFR